MQTHLTISQAAERLGIHRDTLLKWTRRGWIQAHRLPSGQLRISSADLDRLLSQEGAGNA